MATTAAAITRTDLTDLATLANTKLAPGTPYDLSDDGLATELQRIFTDMKAAIAADYLAAEFRVSTHQVVAINPTYSPGEQGRLYFGSASTAIPATNYLPLFRNVEFWYALGHGWTWDDAEISMDDDEVSLDAAPPVIHHRLRCVDIDNYTPTGSGPFTLAFTTVVVAAADLTAPAEFTIEIPLRWPGGGSPVPPVLADFVPTSDFAAPTFTIVAVPSPSFPTPDYYKLVFVATEEILTGSTTFNHSFVSNGPWTFGAPLFAGDGTTCDVLTTGVLEISKSVTDPAVATAIHPLYTCRKVTISDVTNATAYTVNATRGADYLELTERRTCPGIWIAQTLPTPAVNCFVDQDIAPYVQTIVNGAFALYSELSPSLIWSLGVPTANALRSRLVGDGQNPPAYFYTASALKMLTPYNAPEDETVTNQSDNYATFTAGQTLSLTIPFPYWLVAPWARFPEDLTTVGDILTCLTDGAAPCLTIYFSARPGIDPSNPATYTFTVNDTGAGVTLAQIPFSQIATELGPLTRTVYVVIKNTSGASVFLNVGQNRIPDEKTIREAMQNGIATQWPVIRDTDDYPWFPGLDPYRSKATIIDAVTLANNSNQQFDFNIGSAGSANTIRLGMRAYRYTNTPGLPMFVSNVSAPDPTSGATYDFTVTGELTMAQIQAQYGDSYTGYVFVAIRNNTGADVSLTTIRRCEYNSGSEVPGLKYQRAPCLFPTNFASDNPDFIRYGVCESYSYNIISGSGSASNGKLVPRRGYAIYNIRVQRLPVAHAGETDPTLMFGELPPTTGAITVKIGQFRGLKHIDVDVVDKGTFIELLELTIPDGSQDISAEVFWPVLGGAYLAWQGSTPVRVEALVNWQPLFHGYQYAMSPVQVTTSLTPTLPADSLWSNLTLRFDNYFAIGDEGPVQFPPAAAVINDLNAVLALL